MAIKSPNFTQIPNEYFDAIMQKLNGSENLVFLAIMRKTFGWRKKKDRISYSQIMEITGISSRSTISNAIKKLIELKLIESESKKNGNTYGVYVSETSPKTVPVQKIDQSKNCTTGSPKTVLQNEKTSPKTVHTKESNINKLSKESYINIETEYANAFNELFPNGKLIQDYARSRKRIKVLLQKLSESEIISVIQKAKQDEWIKSTGFALTTILGDFQVNKLLNGNNQQTKPTYGQSAVQKSGADDFVYDQAKYDRLQE